MDRFRNRLSRLRESVEQTATIIFLLTAPLAAGQVPDFYKEPGIYPTRSYVGQHASENIDPFTGMLQLHYVDIFVPGNGGFDLKVQRSYNLLQRPIQTAYAAYPYGVPSFAGLGWSMHFGRIVRGDPDFCTSYPNSVGNSVLELPDGSRRILFATNGESSAQFLTPDRWRGDCAGNVLTIRSPDGTSYKMDYLSIVGPEHSRWVTEITDRSGNTMNLSYRSSGGYPVIDRVLTSDGRTLSYSYAGEGTAGVRIAKISANSGVTWSYSYIGRDGYWFLSRVTRPDGTAWDYDYDGENGSGACSYCLRSVTYPQTGRLAYSYALVAFDPQQVDYKSNVVHGKTSSDGGSWSYSYSPGSSYDTTTVNAPEGTYTYRHIGWGRVGNGELWSLGTLVQKSMGSDQVEFYDWGSQIIANQYHQRVSGFGSLKVDTQVKAPILKQKTILRDGSSYTTDYSNFDTHGNPKTVSEYGNVSRTTTRSYWTNTSKWILRRVLSESNSSGSISRSFDSNGNMTHESRYGVDTEFAYSNEGDITRRTDARGYSTTFSNHYRGVPRLESRPEGVSISRQVSAAGNITSETNGEGNTTSFGYDDLNRITSIGLPANSDVSISYGARSRSLRRGSFSETTEYDSFGRPRRISRNGIGISMDFDAAGRKTFESYPGSSSGRSFNLDQLGRITSISYGGGGRESLNYSSANQVSVRDQRGNTTTFQYRSFGDPDEKVLIEIDSPDGTTSLGRDAYGSLLSLAQGGVTRSYSYSSHHYLVSESNPEYGSVSYGRDSNGNMTSKSVAGGGTTSYTYDGLNRVKTIDFPGNSGRNASFSYSRTSKLKSAVNSISARNLTYDANDNVTSETVAIDGRSFTIRYGIDSLDYLDTITYPFTGTLVRFDPDVFGRATSASPFVSSVSRFANGQPSGVNFQNGVSGSLGQTARQWPSSVRYSRNATLASLGYSYDNNGNPTSISDVDASYSLNLGYDSLNRLTSANGKWGSGTISYDGAGNITRMSLGGAVSNYSYSNNRVARVSGATSRNYAYDAYGNVTADGVHAYEYDGAQTLRCVDCAGAKPLQFEYDATGQRVLKTIGASKTYFVHGAQGQLLLEFDPLGNTTTEYVYLDGKQVARRIKSDLEPTTSALTASLNPVTVGATFILTAIVSGGSSPTGTVTFMDGSAVLGTGAVASRQALWSGSIATAGIRQISAVYSGDARNRASTSPMLGLDVSSAVATTTTLGVSPNPVRVGDTVTLTATVAGNQVQGTVAFLDGGQLLQTVSLVNGVASFSTNILAAGSHSMSAQYSGDQVNNLPSTSPVVSLAVNKRESSTTLNVSPNPANYGATVTISVTVNGVQPQGAVRLIDGGGALGDASLVNGVARFTASNLLVGSHQLSAQYFGDPNHLPSSSPTATLVVKKIQSTTILGSSPNPAKQRQPIVFTASISGYNPDGTVAFKRNGVAISSCGVVPLSGSGDSRTASCNYDGLPVGRHTISAIFSGDDRNLSSESAPLMQQVISTRLPAYYLLLLLSD